MLTYVCAKYPQFGPVELFHKKRNGVIHDYCILRIYSSEGGETVFSGKDWTSPIWSDDWNIPSRSQIGNRFQGGLARLK